MVSGARRRVGASPRRQRTARNAIRARERWSESGRAKTAGSGRRRGMRAEGAISASRSAREHRPDAGAEAQELDRARQPSGGARGRTQEGIRQITRTIHRTVQDAHGLHGKD